MLDLLARLGELVRLGGGGPLTREERESREDRILEAITLLWQTEEVRPRRPTVLDEVQSVLSIVGPSLFAVTPGLHAELTRMLAARFPKVNARAARLLEVHSWVGGDRDGNPNVTPEVTRQTIARHRTLALTGYLRRVDQLAQDLSVASTRALVTHELAVSLRTDADELPETAVELERRASIEPYRQKLGFIGERLRRTIATAWDRAVAPPGIYANVDELIADLELVRESLRRARAGRLADGALADLLVSARTFGFHFAALEIRQHSETPRAGAGGDPGGDRRRSRLLGAPRGRARDAPDRASGPGPAAAGQLCAALVGQPRDAGDARASSARSRSAWAATPAPPTSSR